MADATVPKASHPHPLMVAIRECTRFELFNIAVMLFFLLITMVAFPISWAGQNAGLQLQVSMLGTFLVFAVCVWHSVHVKGWGQTVAFFGLTMVLSFLAEYVGANYGWIFGSYDYTSTSGPSINGVSIFVPFTWAILLYAAYMLINWLLDLRGERRGRTWNGKVIWSALIALTTGICVAVWDLMADPVWVSGVWEDVFGKPGWWCWDGVAYLPDLKAWQHVSKKQPFLKKGRLFDFKITYKYTFGRPSEKKWKRESAPCVALKSQLKNSHYETNLQKDDNPTD